MISFEIEPRAIEEVRELRLRYGRRFTEEYLRKRNQLRHSPCSGPPYTDPDCPIPEMRHILLRACQHYLYYTFDEVRQVVTIHTIWANPRGTGPFE